VVQEVVYAFNIGVLQLVGADVFLEIFLLLDIGHLRLLLVPDLKSVNLHRLVPFLLVEIRFAEFATALELFYLVQ